MGASRPATWRRTLALCAMAGMLVAAGFGVVPPVLAQGVPPPLAGFADLVLAVGPAVVNISTTKAQGRSEDLPVPQFPPGSPFEEFFKDFFERDQQQQRQQPRRTFSLGSGFVIDPQGYVVTNNHVIAEADEIKVIFNDESEYRATVVGRDTKTDLALLKIERDAPFPYVEWADSDTIRVGDWMLAIGNPFGLGSTVTSGIVSARGRNINAGPYDDFFQVDAAINRGNSGGPSFTLDGKVFGVNTAIFSPSGGNVGIGFAIPSNLARSVIQSLKDTGRVARGWLGVRIQTVDEAIAESLGLESTAGALIAGVTPGGPAANSDIQAGDIILRFDGKKIEKMRDLPRIVAETPVGRKAEVELFRRGERKTVQIVLGELPEDETLAELGQPEPPPNGAPAQIAELGVSVRELNDELRGQYQIPPGGKGLVIVEVDPAGPAAAENLRPGDLIVEVNQEEVATPADLAARVAKLKQEGKKSALLLVDRQGDLRFVALRFPEG